MALYYRGKDYDNADTIRSYDRKLFRVLWSFAAPFRRLMILSIVIILGAAAADLTRPYLIKLAVDEYMARSDMAGLMQVVYGYAVTVLISAILSYAETLLLQYIGQKIIFNIRAKVFQRLMYQQYRESEGQPVGRMVTRVTNDTDAVKELFTDVLVAFVSDLIILAGIICVMLWMDWRLALVAFTVIPFMIILAILFQKFARFAYRNVREKTAAVNTFLQESINGIRVIKAFHRFKDVVNEYAVINKDYMAAGLREMRVFAFFRPFVDLLYVIATVLLLGYGGWQFENGLIEIGVVIAFLRYVEKFFWPIKDLAEKYNLLQSALAATERIFELIHDKQEEDNENELGMLEFTARAIRFEHVWFAYQAEDWVLQDISFELPAGEFLGIAGPSGSGKTTLISLLLRFYEPQRGHIYLDDVDIRQMPLPVLRQQLGVVFQDVHLFKGSVEENITLFNPAVREAAVREASAITGINAFVQALPQQYDTQVGYEGALLSAGQRQLVSLTRALAFDAQILVLDEATSSIDSATELHIQGALDRIAKTKTILAVAHRLSTVQSADRILVFNHGRLSEQGTHEQLLALRGLYWRMYNSQ